MLIKYCSNQVLQKSKSKIKPITSINSAAFWQKTAIKKEPPKKLEDGKIINLHFTTL